MTKHVRTFTPEDPREKPTEAALLLREAAGMMLSGDQKSRLRHADRLFKSSTNKDREEASAIMTRITRELRAGIDETVALEEARGGEVRQGPGPLVMRDRDGLAALQALEPDEDGEERSLTEEQYGAGMRFREGWEARSEGVGSQMGAMLSGGAAHDNDRFVETALSRAKKLQLAGRIEFAVAVQCRDEPAALQMLREVAGHGKALSVFGRGRAFDRHLTALKRALDVADKLIRG